MCRLIPIIVGLPFSALMFLAGLEMDYSSYIGSISGGGLISFAWVPVSVGVLAIMALALRVYMREPDAAGGER